MPTAHAGSVSLFKYQSSWLYSSPALVERGVQIYVGSELLSCSLSPLRCLSLMVTRMFSSTVYILLTPVSHCYCVWSLIGFRLKSPEMESFHVGTHSVRDLCQRSSRCQYWCHLLTVQFVSWVISKNVPLTLRPLLVLWTVPINTVGVCMNVPTSEYRSVLLDCTFSPADLRVSN